MIKWFWLIVSVGCIVWYLTVLGYVIIKGADDIKSMLRNITGRTTEDKKLT